MFWRDYFSMCFGKRAALFQHSRWVSRPWRWWGIGANSWPVILCHLNAKPQHLAFYDPLRLWQLQAWCRHADWEAVTLRDFYREIIRDHASVLGVFWVGLVCQRSRTKLRTAKEPFVGDWVEKVSTIKFNCVFVGGWNLNLPNLSWCYCYIVLHVLPKTDAEGFTEDFPWAFPE